MIGVRAKVRDETYTVVRKAKEAHFESLSHAGGAIRKTAIRSIRKATKPAPPGQPPHTQTRRLPRAIKYTVEKKAQVVVIGPDIESFGIAGRAHEFGGRFRGDHYERRPFMRPALEKLKNRVPWFWANSIKR